MKFVISLTLTCTMNLFLISCSGAKSRNNIDPLEPVNRKVHALNNILNGLYIKPVSNLYKKIVPYPIKASINNAISNLGELPSTANHFLQAKVNYAFSSMTRFAINSSLGIFGLFDVATELGIKRQKQDLGQTLAKWGWSNSAYIILPILGPSTIRDTVGFFGNSYMNIPTYLEPSWRNSYYVMSLINSKSEFSEAEKIFEAAGVDNYAAVRNGYLQYRNFKISNGISNQNQDDQNIDLGEPPA